MASLLPQLYFDSGSGLAPSDGSKLFFFIVGSGTPKNIYTDATEGTPLSNPVIANAKGVFAQIFITGDYDWVLQDKSSVQKNAGSVSEFQTAGVKNFATLALAVADTGLADGDALNIAERTTGNGGGAMWDVVLSSTVTENTFNIVQCTGVGTLSLVLRLVYPLNVLQFGAQGGGTFDDYPAFNAAYDDLPVSGGAIYIPATATNKWRFSQPLDIRKMVHIIGQIAQGGSGTTHGTQILVDADESGFIFNSLGTSGAGLTPGYAYNINPYSITSMPTDGLEGAYGSILENVSIQSIGGTSTGHGVHIRAQMECRKVHCRDFAENGFHIHASINSADDSFHGDSNQWVLRNCKSILNGGDGIYVDGLDANAGLCDKFFSQLNAGYGAYDNSFLSNTYISFDTAGNGIAPFWSDRITSETTLIGCHDDGAGGSIIGSAVTSIGGNGLQPAIGQLGFHQTGGLARHAPFKHLNQNGSEDVSNSLGFNDSSLTIQAYGTQSESAAANSWRVLYNPTQHVWYHQFAGSVAFRPIAWPNSASLRYLDHLFTGPTFQNGYAVKSSGDEENALSRTLGTSAPTTNTYIQGDIVYDSTPTAGGFIGWVCITAGTAGTLNGGSTTGGITSGTPDLVVNDATGLKVGQYITIAGVSGIKQITVIVGTAVTINSNAGATVAGASVAWSTHAFKTFGAISS